MNGGNNIGGCEYVDQVEQIAIDRVCKIFGANYANVQPNSGSQANQAVMLALLKPGDTILGMSLPAGGHLTHGASPNLSGKWFNAIGYGVSEKDHLIDYEEIESLATKNSPKLIIAGGSAYPRIIDFARLRKIADKVNAYLMVDMAHFAGLVAADQYPNPIKFADIVTSTTHKTLRGPRGGIILSNDPDIAKKINSAVFPGLQGGPLMHVIAGKAVAFGEILTEEFKLYGKKIVENAKILAHTLTQRGFSISTGGTDSHLMLVDLRSRKITGNIAEISLERAGLTCNKNSIPFDPEKPIVKSGIRLGTPAGTTRGFGTEEFKQIGNMIADTLDGLAQSTDNSVIEKAVKDKVSHLCKKFPLYS